MNIAFYLKLYALTVPVFFVVDLIWLGVVAKGFYHKNLNSLLSPNVNWAAAIIFYLIFIAGILIFAVIPALAKDSWRHAALWGALFGFFTYMTYELTNLALLKNWPLNIVIVDILWGLCCARPLQRQAFTSPNGCFNFSACPISDNLFTGISFF